MNAEVGLEDILTPKEFEAKYPNLFDGPGCPKMEYLVRTRQLNGLSDCGAIVEPAHRRPMIVPPKFLQWLLSRKKAA